MNITAPERNDRGLEMGLILCLYSAVLAFGATGTLTFALPQLLAFGLAGVVVWRRWEEPVSPRLALIVISLLLYVLAQRFLWLSRLEVRAADVLRWLAVLCVFWVAIHLCRARKTLYRLVLALIILGAFESLYGLVQYLAGWHYIFAYRKIFYTAQATGTYINPNHFAGLLEMVLPFGLALGLYQLERPSGTGWKDRSQSATHHHDPGSRAALFFFTCLVLFAGVLASRSRTGILSALGGAGLTGLLWACSTWRRSRTALLLGSFFVLAGITAAWIGLEPILARYATAQTDFSLRLSIWHDTLSLTRENVWFGTGLGTFRDAFPLHQTTYVNGLVDHAHNDYLQFATELGVPAALLLWGLILAVLARGVVLFFRSEYWRERFILLGACGGVSALLIHSAADFNLQIPANALVFVTLLALICASDGHLRAQPAKQPRGRTVRTGAISPAAG